MALLNDCGNIYYQSLPACADGFTVSVGLDPDADYWWILTDKFGHVYSEVVTTDSAGAFIVSADDFPPGFFNPYAGQMELEIKGNPYYCEPLEFTVCEVAYSRMVIDFKEGNLPALIPCVC
jgi:hypothetical protein